MNKFLLIFISLILYGCNQSLTSSDNYDCSNSDCELSIYSVFQQLTPLVLDENNHYHFNYYDQNLSDYGTLYYTTTDPMIRVAWSSPDSFYVVHMGQIIGSSVINYSTYSGEGGDSQQLFYVNSTFIHSFSAFRMKRFSSIFFKVNSFDTDFFP